MYKKLVNTMSLVLLLSLISMVTSPVMVYPTVADSNYGLEVFAQGPRGLFGMAFDKEGNLYVAHEGYIDAPAGTDILKITPKGEVTTYATGFTGPSGLAFDRKGNLWVSDDRGPNGIHRINPDGSITTFTFYPLINPNAIAFDKDWNLFVADAGTGCIYKIPPPYNDNEIITFAVGFSTPESVDIDKSGNVYTSDMLGKIYKIDPSGSVVVFAEGLGWTNGGLVLDKMGNVYASFPPNVLVFTPDGVGKVFVTGFTSYPRGLVFDVEGRLYITDCNAGIIWRFTPSKIVFNSRVVGECWIAYGGIGPGIPSPIEWSGLGMGDARIRGSAEAVVPYKISGLSLIHISEPTRPY